MAARRIRTSTQVSFANFGKRMNKLGIAAVTNTNQGVKDAASLAVTSLIDDTPKLTNQAAANWQVSIGVAIAEYKVGYTDIGGAKALALAEISKREPGQSVHIQNLAPYITLLNNGWSKQAPSGFLEQALIRANNHLRSIKVLKDV